MSEFLRHEPCPECGSRDNLARYADGSGYCFGCGHYEKGDGEFEAPPPETQKKRALIAGDYEHLGKRKISEETCRHFRYQVGTFKGQKCHIAPYSDADGRTVAQKIRLPGKNFVFLGDPKAARMFGAERVKPGGKWLVITEGEIDALSIHECFDANFPAISLINGSKSAAKAIKAELELIESFEKVVVWFDDDEPGRAAVEAVKELVSPGRLYVAAGDYKDANEVLQKQGPDAVRKTVFRARASRPDGVINAADVAPRLTAPVPAGISYPWQGLNGYLYGQREAELVSWCAGTGVGKSAVTAELAFDLLGKGETVGYIALEEDTIRTARRFVGLALDVPYHLPNVEVSDADRETAIGLTIGTERLWLYDHFGSLASDNLLSKIRYMVKTLGCRAICLDHLSIVVSGMETEDERKAIDVLMTNLRSLVQETGCTMHLVSHLKRSQGKAHEEGGEISLSHLRGSQAIAQLSDAVVALERNQQASSDAERNLTKVRVLKNRFAGTTGLCMGLRYQPDTGRLVEVPVEVLKEEKWSGPPPDDAL